MTNQTAKTVDETHIMPSGYDAKDHVSAVSCQCRPKLVATDTATGAQTWEHVALIKIGGI